MDATPHALPAAQPPCRSAAVLHRLGLALLLGTLLLIAVCGAAAQEKPKDAEVIYPRTSAAPDAPAAAGRDGGSNTLMIVLALGAAAAGGWLLWRQRVAPAAGGAPRKLVISESRSLGNRQHLVVAEYDGRKFLLGVCPGRIDLLSPLARDDDDLESP